MQRRESTRCATRLPHLGAGQEIQAVLTLSYCVVHLSVTGERRFARGCESSLTVRACVCRARNGTRIAVAAEPTKVRRTPLTVCICVSRMRDRCGSRDVFRGGHDHRNPHSSPVRLLLARPIAPEPHPPAHQTD